MAIPVTLFPAAPATTFTKNDKLKNALAAAIGSRTTSVKGAFPIAITLIDLGSADLDGDTSAPASLAFGGFRDDKEDYNASVAKIGILYAAYIFRDMVRRFALVNPPAAKMNDAQAQAILFKQLRDTLGAAIDTASRRVHGGTAVKAHRLPTYESVFKVKKAGNGLEINFTTAYSHSLDQMIIPSDNGHARNCVHGLGFGYLNGALAAGKFFDDDTGLGFWCGGDFQLGKDWPPVRIATDNDGSSSVGATSDSTARLLALMLLGGIPGIDKDARDGMRRRLQKAAVGIDVPWLTRPKVANRFSSTEVTHNKLGLGPLNAGGDVYSEATILKGVGKNTYSVAWQNLQSRGNYGFGDVATIIRDTIKAYE